VRVTILALVAIAGLLVEIATWRGWFSPDKSALYYEVVSDAPLLAADSVTAENIVVTINNNRV